MNANERELIFKNEVFRIIRAEEAGSHDLPLLSLRGGSSVASVVVRFWLSSLVEASAAGLASRRAGRAARQARIAGREVVWLESGGSLGYDRGLKSENWEMSIDDDAE